MSAMHTRPVTISSRPLGFARRADRASTNETGAIRRGYTRAQLVDQIMAHNATATEMFLSGFSERELETYLDHLLSAQRPRGRDAVWQRPGDAPAIWSARTVA